MDAESNQMQPGPDSQMGQGEETASGQKETQAESSACSNPTGAPQEVSSSDEELRIRKNRIRT